MKAFPQLSTDRLILRRVDTEDIPAMVKYANNRTIADNTLTLPYPYTVDDAVNWISFSIQGYRSGERYIFAIELKESHEFIGAIGLHVKQEHNKAEIGFWLGEPFWNRGIMSEALRAVLDYGFNTLHFNKLFATHFLENTASGKVLQKAGMIQEAVLKDEYRIKGKYRSVVQYRLTEAEYQALQGKAGNEKMALPADAGRK